MVVKILLAYDAKLDYVNVVSVVIINCDWIYYIKLVDIFYHKVNG